VQKTFTACSSAAGCFWGPELAFQRVHGVIKTNVGYSNGHAESPTYEDVCTGDTGHTEAVQIAYDKETVSMQTLLEVFWDQALKDPLQKDGQGNDRGRQYRAGIYYHNAEQRDAAQAFLVRCLLPWVLFVCLFGFFVFITIIARSVAQPQNASHFHGKPFWCTARYSTIV
jgi:methionine-S-sulfoxide reductase